MKSTLPIAIILCACSSTSDTRSNVNAEAFSNMVLDWNAIAENATIQVATQDPVVSAISLAIVHAAIYDAVNAIDGRFTRYAVIPHVPVTRDANQDAAAATAAHDMLLVLFPAQQATLDSAYVASMATITGRREPIDRGVAIGHDVAAQLTARRANDGRFANVPYMRTFGPGAWAPTPPGFVFPPVDIWVATSSGQPRLVRNSRAIPPTSGESIQPGCGPTQLGAWLRRLN